jgi:hypothetical protein
VTQPPSAPANAMRLADADVLGSPCLLALSLRAPACCLVDRLNVLLDQWRTSRWLM